MKSVMRRCYEFLREDFGRAGWEREVFQRGNFTMVKLVFRRVGSEGEAHQYEGIGFSKRDPHRYLKGDAWDECGKIYHVYSQDQYSAEEGVRLATERALKDMAAAVYKASAVGFTMEGKPYWSNDDDIPF